MLCADSAIPKLEIFGPYGLMHYLATMRGYTYRYAHFMSVQMRLHDEDGAVRP